MIGFIKTKHNQKIKSSSQIIQINLLLKFQYYLFKKQMKQFEKDLKAKAHLKKIQNAKTTINNPKFRATQIKQDDQENIALLLKQYDSNDFKTIPVYKLLKHYNLQQYTRQMILRGYGVNISKLSYLNDNDRNKMFQDIKILPGHTLKFVKMIEQISKNLENTDQNVSIYSNNNMPSEIANKQSYSNIEKPFMKQLDEKDDYQQQLEQILNQYTPQQPKGKTVVTSKISVNAISTTSAIQGFKKQKQDVKSYRNSKNSVPSVNSKLLESGKKPVDVLKKTIVINNENIKKPVSVSSKPTIKNNIKENAKGSVPNKKLPPSLKGLSTQKKRDKIQIDLNLDKIKMLYMSMDGGIMTSTIVNIDLEQQCYCIASYLQKNIQAAPRKISQQKQSIVSESQNIIQKQQQTQDVSQILRQSYLHPLYKQNNQENIQVDQEIDKSYQQQDQNQNKQENQKLAESSFLGNNSSVCFGVNNALDIFQQPSPTQVDYYIPTVDSLANFIKNIVLSAKMEREVPILSLLYVQKFIKNTKLQFNSLNYKRILISCLLLASKVWDDESFQTPSFSHTFPDYTTVLLNQLEKQILVAINYELKLDKKQYALIYYKLRQFRSAKTKSYQNRALNVLRVRQLQKGIKKQYRRDFLTKRKSF